MTKRRKRSSIFKVSKKEFLDIIKDKRDLKEILTYFNLTNHGNNYKTLKKRFVQDKIDITLFKSTFKKPLKDISEHLTENSSFSRNSLKRNLIKSGLLKKECYNPKCKIKNEWLGEFISLQIDHINGINNDNRLSNLRLLCPNCHSQTPSFAGKKLKKPSLKCQDCGNLVGRKTKRCMDCYLKRVKKVKIFKKIKVKKNPVIKTKCLKCPKTILSNRKTHMCLKCYQASRKVDLVENRDNRKRLSYKYSQKFMDKLVKDKRKGMSYNALAKKYNLAKSTVYYIVKNI